MMTLEKGPAGGEFLAGRVLIFLRPQRNYLSGPVLPLLRRWILRCVRVKRRPRPVGIAIHDAPPILRQASSCPWQVRYFVLGVVGIAGVDRDRDGGTGPHDAAVWHLEIFAGLYVGAFVDHQLQLVGVEGNEYAHDIAV